MGSEWAQSGLTVGSQAEAHSTKGAAAHSLLLLLLLLLHSNWFRVTCSDSLKPFTQEPIARQALTQL